MTDERTNKRTDERTNEQTLVIVESLSRLKMHLLVPIVKLGSRSKVHLKSLIRDLDLELVAIIARLHPPTQQTFLSRITLKSLNV